jgi:hypothetical protein
MWALGLVFAYGVFVCWAETLSERREKIRRLKRASNENVQVRG